MNDKDERAKKGLAAMEAQVAISGVASLRFQDGQMFMFSAEKLAELAETAKKAGSAIIWVQSGSSIDAPEHNN